MSLNSPAEKHKGAIRRASPVVDIREDTKSRDERLSESDYASATDERLVRALAHRDAKAIESLYDRYGSYVYSMCLRMVRDVQLAEDLTQEVFLRLWKRPELYDLGRGRFLTWLLSVARNRSIDEQRSRGRRFRFEEPPSLAIEEILASAPATSSKQDPAVASDERVVIQRALASLPSDQRVVIQMAYFGGYTQQEISDGLGQPLGTVKTRIRLGLQKLRNILIDLRDVGSSQA